MSNYSSQVIAAAEAAQRAYGVPASVSLAQYAEESGYGRYMPPGSNNPFGIKAVKGQPMAYAHTREENRQGGSYYIDAPFRKFGSIADAFDAHAKLLATVPLYHSAMVAWTAQHDLQLGVELMAKHYATAHNYATVVLSIIHSQNLQQYDRLAEARV